MILDRQPEVPAPGSQEPLGFRDEEDTSAETTPRKDLISAVVIAVLAVAVMFMSVRLDSPDRLFTAPGLLPFVIALALLVMAGALGWRAVSDGAARGFFAALAAGVRDRGFSGEDRRGALLAGLMLAYVLLVAALSFELRISTEFMDFVFSGYELISILITTTILRLFWRSSLLRCLLVAVISVEVLAFAFRYGFNMIMPEAF
jgi:hypothetical protein